MALIDLKEGIKMSMDKITKVLFTTANGWCKFKVLQFVVFFSVLALELQNEEDTFFSLIQFSRLSHNKNEKCLFYCRDENVSWL